MEGKEVDFFWPEQRLIVETDGRGTHLTPAAFERDRARDARLLALGYRVLRFTDLQVRSTKPRSPTGCEPCSARAGCDAMAALRAMTADELLQYSHEPYRTELIAGRLVEMEPARSASCSRRR